MNLFYFFCVCSFYVAVFLIIRKELKGIIQIIMLRPLIEWRWYNQSLHSFSLWNNHHFFFVFYIILQLNVLFHTNASWCSTNNSDRRHVDCLTHVGADTCNHIQLFLFSQIITGVDMSVSCISVGAMIHIWHIESIMYHECQGEPKIQHRNYILKSLLWNGWTDSWPFSFLPFSKVYDCCY